MSVEQILNIPKEPNLQTLEKNTGEFIKTGNEFLVKGMPQIEAICERNPIAVQEFFKKFLKIEKV